MVRMPQPLKVAGPVNVATTRRAALRPGDPGEEGVAGVGAHATGLLGAVERQREGADLLAPEGLVEADLESGGLLGQACGDPGVAEDLRQLGGGALGSVDVALNLTQRAISAPDARAAVLVEVEILAVVLPALVQPLLGLPVIFDEAVAVAIAVFVAPAERRLDLRPDAPRSSRGRPSGRNTGRPASRRAASRRRCRR